MTDRQRPTWSRHRDARAEQQAQRFDDITDVILTRWKSAEVARVDAAWEKLYPMLPSDAVSDWLDNLAASVNSGANWSPTFPVARTETQPHVPVEDDHIKTVSKRQFMKLASNKPTTPARARRQRLYEDVVRLSKAGVRQMDIATQLNISQPTVSLWLRKGIK